MFYLEVVHFCFLRENLVQQLSQLGDVPLVVTQWSKDSEKTGKSCFSAQIVIPAAMAELRSAGQEK